MEINERTAPVSQQPDQNSISLDLMNRMRMHGMSEAFRESLAGTVAQAMTPDSFLYMLLSREWDYRSQAAVTRMTKNAAFRYKAYLEEIDYNVSRGLDRNQMERLSTLDFVKAGKNLFITGPSGTGKSFLACALGHEACKKGIRTLYA
ncbi:MAG: ATP-binding protein, partial [Muribaculaceae bacterium]|nr:ATP-binding protein [Muribaculaceae bacterium]